MTPKSLCTLVAVLISLLPFPYLYTLNESVGQGSFEETSYEVNSLVEWSLTSPSNTTELFRAETTNVGTTLSKYITPPRAIASSVNYYTHYFSGGYRTVAYYEGHIFQVWRDSTGRSVYLRYSVDNGSTFSSPILVASSSTDYLAFPGVLVEEGRIHVFYRSYYGRKYYEKWVNITDTVNITRATPLQVNVYYSNDYPYVYYDVTSDRSYIYLVHTTSNHRLQLWRRAKTSSSWESSPINLTGTRKALYCAITSTAVGSRDYLVVAYARYFQWGVSDGYVHTFTLRNYGTTTVYSRTAISATRNFRQLSIVSDGGYNIYLTASLSSQDDIYFTKSTNLGGSWGPAQVIVANRGSPSQGYIAYDQSIGRDSEGRLVVVYEHSSSNIYMVYSTDNGNSWTPEYKQVKVVSGSAFDPCIATCGYVIDYLTGSNPYSLKQVSIFVPAVEGTFNTTARVSLPLLRYDAIFVNASYHGEGEVLLRVFNGEDNGLLMNWTTINFSASGWAGGLHYTAIISLSGMSWAERTPPMKVYFEFKIKCPIWEKRPFIRWVALNFTAAYPYWDNFTDLTGISYYEEMDYSDGRFKLKIGALFAKIETEIIQIEDRYPDYLMLNVRNLSSSNYLKVEVRDGIHPYPPIPGFSRSECNILTEGGGWERVSWGGRQLGDLSTSYKRIKIVIYVTSDQSLLPEIHGLALVRNNPPQIRLLSVNTTEVYRGSSVIINVHGTDYEDPPEGLAVICQMKRVDEESWQPAPVTRMEYEAPFWELTLTPPLNITTGAYQIRVKVSDTRGAESTWAELNQQLRVLNNRPTKPEVEIEEDPVTILTDVHISIKRPSVDVETPSNDLTYRITLYRNGHYFDEKTIKEDEVVVVPRQELNKGQSWQVKAEAYDGENYSEPEFVEFHVINLPPQSDVGYLEIDLQEDVGKSIDLKEVFYDPDDQTLQYFYSGNKDIFLTIEDDILYLSPRENYYGEESFILGASDGELETQISILVRVEAVNDLPSLEVPPLIRGREGEWLEVHFNASDEADQEEVTVTTNITSVVEGLVNRVNFYLLKNGFRLLPDNNMVGEYTIEVVATDESGGSVSRQVKLIILNVNNPPESIYIRKPSDGAEFSEGSPIEFVGEAKDPDTLHGQVLIFTWYSNITGDIGRGSTLTNVTLPVGIHKITFTVDDGEYQRNRSITIRVVKKPAGGISGESETPGETEGPPSESRGGKNYLYIIIILAALIVVAAAGVIFMLKRGEEKTAEEGRREIPPFKKKGESASGARQGSAAGTPKPSATHGRGIVTTTVRPPVKTPIKPPVVAPGGFETHHTPPPKPEEHEDGVELEEIRYIRPGEGS